ncbi:hypothetical protein MTR67_009380 [Solanum verrucosum]|uniref:MULE transposase domain-containing protein n=1 Tax=Solanum verrucosum TaxID=315347 RepID=A0AAF0Q5K1_SOLVR|nr:hypothetical protein MTR67_009380 [Solanum verrucosum]
MLEIVVVIDDVSTDCASDGTENDSDTSNDNSNYNSEELNVLAQERRRIIDGSLCDYKDLHKVVCKDKCNFVCLISGEKHVAGVRVKTLKGEHNKCKDPCGNYKVSATTMAFYFKEKFKANPKYKIKEMRVDMNAFNINAHFEKCKRTKRMILEDMEGSLCDDYKKIVGYANALKESNPGTDVVLKGKAKGQLLSAIGQDSMNHFYLIAWAIMDRECKTSWVWVLELLQKSLNINSGEGITFMSDMQKANFHALFYKSLDPLEEIHWWYSKEAYLLTYHCKLQPMPGQKFWKIEAEQAMEPPELFNQNSEEDTSNTGKVKSKKKKMDKQCDKGKKQTNERHKTQPTQDCASDEDEDFGFAVEDDMPWKPRDFSPKGSTWKGNAPETENMLEQLRKEKMDMRSNKKKKQGNERHRILIDEEDVENFPLTAPQPTQDEDFGLDVEDDMPWKPKDFSELNSRIQQRQKQARPTRSRRINFLGDGSSAPSDLYAPKGLTGRMLEQSRVEKLKTTRVMARHNNDKFSNEDNVLLFCCMFLRY